MGQTISDCASNRKIEHQPNELFGSKYKSTLVVNSLKYTDFIDTSDLYVKRIKRRKNKRTKKDRIRRRNKW